MGECHRGCRCRGCASAEGMRQIQAWRRTQLEAEEEASDCRSQGSESFHQGAVRLQGEASLQDSQGASNEEVQGDGQLSLLSCELLRVATAANGGRPPRSLVRVATAYPRR